ncbi:winged helix-turn-helix domain-containing protein, partial [Streptomyces aurantiacus]
MDIDVLGALAVRENGISITPSAPKPRQVLALLALNADRVVPVSALSEELWGASPPRSARTTLQTYVLQLRELIDRALTHDSTRPGSTRPGPAPRGSAQHGSVQHGGVQGGTGRGALTGGRLTEPAAQPPSAKEV